MESFLKNLNEPVLDTLRKRDSIFCVICTVVILDNWLDTYLMVFRHHPLLKLSIL